MNLRTAILSAAILLTGCAAHHHDEHAGMDAHCEACDMTVQNHPHAATQASAMYTCPMHPEVMSATQGECPKCHMKLEKAGEAHDHGAAK